MKITFESLGVDQPDVLKSGVPLWKKETVSTALTKLINTNSKQHFGAMENKIMKEIKNATEIVNETIKHFENTYDKFLAIETHIHKDIKTKVGDIKAAEERLMQGLSRIEKAANFDRLEKYVDLIERASKAMELLAGLEKEGRLEKIATAIR